MCVNPEWSEPAILWTVVAARKGEKKTAALKKFVSIVEVSKLSLYYIIVIIASIIVSLASSSQ